MLPKTLFGVKLFPPSHTAKLIGDYVQFYLTAPNYWEGYWKTEFTQPETPKFQMRRDDFSYKYIVEYFNTNQRAIAQLLNSPQDAISVLDVSIKLGVKY
jgi:hypothetical protein